MSCCPINRGREKENKNAGPRTLPFTTAAEMTRPRGEKMEKCESKGVRKNQTRVRARKIHGPRAQDMPKTGDDERNFEKTLSFIQEGEFLKKGGKVGKKLNIKNPQVTEIKIAVGED